MRKTIIFLLMLLLQIGCSNEKSNSIGIDLSNIEFLKNGEILRYVRKLDFVVIDTAVSIVGSINKIIVDNDCYIIQIGKVNTEILILNKNGQQVGSIDKRGNGPGEYREITNYTYNFRTKEILVFDILSKSLYSFSKEGQFNYQKCLNIQATDLISDDYCLYLYTKKLPSELGDGKEIVIFDENYNLVNSYFDYSVQPLRMRYSSQNVFARNSSSKIFFSNVFRDTTYVLNKKDCKPYVIYNIPNKLPERYTTDNNLYNQHFRDYCSHRGYFTLTDHWVSFNIQEKGRSYDYYMSFNSGKIFKSLFTQISPNLYLKTPLSNDSKKFYYVLPTEWIEGHEDEFKEILHKYEHDDLLNYFNQDILYYNPVIVSIEFLDL